MASLRSKPVALGPVLASETRKGKVSLRCEDHRGTIKQGAKGLGRHAAEGR